MLEYQSV